MKILLIGEYSRLHNSLKEGLIKNGHEVLLVGSGDGFKNYPVDIDISAKTKKIGALFLITKLIHKLTRFDISKIEVAIRFYLLLPKLKDFDVVQLINENTIKTFISTEIWFLKKIKEQNKKLFLLSCGTDYVSVKYAFDKKIRYSILTPFHSNPKLKKKYKHSILKYISKQNYKLHDFLYKNINGVIASDMDYHIPLENNTAYLGLIPNPINSDKLKFTPMHIKNKITIFHGINTENAFKKGNLFFSEALKNIEKKHPDKVKIITTEDVPYNDYIKSYNECHILLDQVYSFDQGYNALEAMAKGKVVFTGAEKEWLDYYNLKENTVAINALPNTDDITKKLEWLILNPEKLIEISKNARHFIEKEHDFIKIAQRYVSCWEKY
ncbi:glycosyltransferase [Tamlana sp. I1]|uniref:glycosyltransferase n=1 Tax=Tamlana sp. I1 TaxID=2762061 RepID=UPI00188DF7B6|nr:glycosyltransferase [Tamlana sp. I1]